MSDPCRAGADLVRDRVPARVVVEIEHLFLWWDELRRDGRGAQIRYGITPSFKVVVTIEDAWVDTETIIRVGNALAESYSASMIRDRFGIESHS